MEISLGKYKLSPDSWPIGYEVLFGFNYQEYQRYFGSVRIHRYNAFRTLKQECHPAAVVCFGMSHWKHFEEVFELSNEEFDEFPKRQTKVYPSSQVVLTRHFSNGMPDNLVEFVGAKVRPWVGQIP